MTRSCAASWSSARTTLPSPTALADQYVAWQLDSGYVAAEPCTVWWRDGFDGGRRMWLTDEEHGRAGVFFREVVERTPSPIETGVLCRDNGPEGGGNGSAQA